MDSEEGKYGESIIKSGDNIPPASLSQEGPVQNILLITPRGKAVQPLDFCKCVKSLCKKNYCECFRQGMKCKDKCKCIECKNIP